MNKAAAKAAKKAKAAAKVERKEKKKVGKGHDEEDDGEDLEAILENVSRWKVMSGNEIWVLKGPVDATGMGSEA